MSEKSSTFAAEGQFILTGSNTVDKSKISHSGNSRISPMQMLPMKLYLRLKRLIIEHNKTEKQNPIREPDLMMVITGGMYGYRRNDGVYVVPLACLRP